jgi:hypothetical protein
MGKTFKDHKDDRNDKKVHQMKKNQRVANTQLIREWENDAPIDSKDLEDFKLIDSENN